MKLNGCENQNDPGTRTARRSKLFVTRRSSRSHRHLFRLKQSDDLTQLPNVIGQASRHRGSNSERGVNPREVVVNEMHRDGQAVIAVHRRAVADIPARDQLGVRIDGNPRPHVASFAAHVDRDVLFFCVTERPDFIALNLRAGKVDHHFVSEPFAGFAKLHTEARNRFLCDASYALRGADGIALAEAGDYAGAVAIAEAVHIRRLYRVVQKSKPLASLASRPGHKRSCASLSCATEFEHRLFRLQLAGVRVWVESSFNYFRSGFRLPKCLPLRARRQPRSEVAGNPHRYSARYEPCASDHFFGRPVAEGLSSATPWLARMDSWLGGFAVLQVRLELARATGALRVSFLVRRNFQRLARLEFRRPLVAQVEYLGDDELFDQRPAAFALAVATVIRGRVKLFATRAFHRRVFLRSVWPYPVVAVFAGLVVPVAGNCSGCFGWVGNCFHFSVFLSLPGTARSVVQVMEIARFVD